LASSARLFRFLLLPIPRPLKSSLFLCARRAALGFLSLRRSFSLSSLQSSFLSSFVSGGPPGVSGWYPGYRSRIPHSVFAHMPLSSLAMFLFFQSTLFPPHFSCGICTLDRPGLPANKPPVTFCPLAVQAPTRILFFFFSFLRGLFVGAPQRRCTD